MDAPASMTKTEADIYRLLESDRGRFFSYREIFSAVCGVGYYADERAICVHMSNMRKKSAGGERIEARRSVGCAPAHVRKPPNGTTRLIVFPPVTYCNM